MSLITHNLESSTHHPQSTTHNLFLRLSLIGLVTQLIYVIYIVAFPLISNTQAGGPAADLEILMRGYRWFAPIYVLGLFLLYYLFWQALRIASRAGDQLTGNRLYLSNLKLFILTFGLLFGFTLIWLYPITANDLFRYVVRGRVWAIHGANPMVTPPDAFPNDPYFAFAGEFGNLPSVYGPLWELAAQLPLRLGATDMVAGSVGLKLMLQLCYLICAYLLGWQANPEKGSRLTALIFFAWNPLILMQGLGNGHNDLLFMTLMLAGLILWQRNLWWAASVALTLAALAKIPALLMLFLFGLALLRRQSTWRQSLLKGLAAAALSLITIYSVYAFFGPISATLQGTWVMLAGRRGFAIASALRMVLREIISWPVAETLPRTTAQYIFLCFYAWFAWQLWRKKLTLVSAGFLTYFSLLMLNRTFHIWYPMWLVPLAALCLTPATFWRTFLFGLTSELSIVNYFVVWRWWLRDLPWEKLGLSTTLYYWPVMHLLTIPWQFGIPLFGPIFIRWWRNRSNYHPTGPI